MVQVDPKASLLLLARLIVSAVFLMAALPKIQDPVAFAASIEGFRVLGSGLTPWVAWLLPWLELVAGFGLLIPQIRRGSGLILTLLLIVFIGLHASAWARGLDIDCGCFGESDLQAAPNYLWLILRNVSLLAASVCLLIRDCLQPESSRR